MKRRTKGHDESVIVKAAKHLGMIAVLLLLFVGCGKTDVTTTPTIQEGNIDKANFNGSGAIYWYQEPFDASHVITVKPHDGDTPQILSDKFDGETLFFVQNDIALVGLSISSSGQPSGQILELVEDYGGTIEETTNDEFTAGSSATMSGGTSVWAGGGTSVWAGGGTSVWAGGGTSVWAGGSFDWMPENTGLWKQINLEQAHISSKNLGNKVIVAVIDTGVDMYHPALKEAMVDGWDFVDSDKEPFDEGKLGADAGTGHGTNVAGIVRQVAPRASILPIRVLDTDGSGSLVHVAQAIYWAYFQGADVINLSLGSTSPTPTVQQAIDFVSNNGNVYVSASTGNTGDKQVTYPAYEMHKDQNQVSVTSVDADDLKSGFATFRQVVEISAPGEFVYSPAPGERMAAWSGTSMAAPMVAGSMALLLGELSERQAGTINLGSLLKNTADNKIYNMSDNQPYYYQMGTGRLDIGTAMNVIRP